MGRYHPPHARLAGSYGLGAAAFLRRRRRRPKTGARPAGVGAQTAAPAAPPAAPPLPMGVPDAPPPRASAEPTAQRRIYMPRRFLTVAACGRPAVGWAAPRSVARSGRYPGFSGGADGFSHFNRLTDGAGHPSVGPSAVQQAARPATPPDQLQGIRRGPLATRHRGAPGTPRSRRSTSQIPPTGLPPP